MVISEKCVSKFHDDEVSKLQLSKLVTFTNKIRNFKFNKIIHSTSYANKNNYRSSLL